MEKDGYGGRSRRLKQVWALQTEEAVQSSECFEWNEILSSGVCACLSFIFKLVCCQFSHSFWKHFENVLTWTIQNWILLREIISLKNFSLHFHNHLKSIWHIYCYLFSCLELQRQVCIFISLLMLGCFFFFPLKVMKVSSCKVICFQSWHLPECFLKSQWFCIFSFCWSRKSTECLWRPHGLEFWEIPWLDFPVVVSRPLLLLWLLCYNLISPNSWCKIMAI